MKILHLITSLKVGGAESALVNYLSNVVNKDGNTHIVAYFHSGPNLEKIQNLGVETHKISGLLINYDPLFFLRLIKLIHKLNPDILHSSLWSANISARLIYKFYNIPVICDLHGNNVDEGKFRNWFDKKTVSLCNKIVAVSDSVKDVYLKNIIAAIKDQNIRNKISKNLVVIKNGIDAEALQFKATQNPLKRSDFGLDETDFIIGAIGRLEAIKSYDVLIKAFARFLINTPQTKAKLFIVGDGSQKEILNDLVKTRGIQFSVIFTGFRPDAYRFYPLFDSFALSSQSEGLSIALLEAMTFGLSIISTNLDVNTHDVIKPGQNGLLVKPNDIEGYAQAIKTLYENRPLAQLMGARNAELVKSDFSINRTVTKYHETYKELVNQNKGEDFL